MTNRWIRVCAYNAWSRVAAIKNSSALALNLFDLDPLEVRDETAPLSQFPRLVEGCGTTVTVDVACTHGPSPGVDGDWQVPEAAFFRDPPRADADVDLGECARSPVTPIHGAATLAASVRGDVLRRCFRNWSKHVLISDCWRRNMQSSLAATSASTPAMTVAAFRSATPLATPSSALVGKTRMLPERGHD